MHSISTDPSRLCYSMLQQELVTGVNSEPNTGAAVLSGSATAAADPGERTLCATSWMNPNSLVLGVHAIFVIASMHATECLQDEILQ